MKFSDKSTGNVMVNLVSTSKSRDRQVANGTDLFIYLHQY